MKHLLPLLALPLLAAAPAPQPAPAPSPNEIVAKAAPAEWIDIAPADLLVMDLVPDAKGKARRVVIQLMPAPFSQGWIGNIRKLATAHWWDGLAVVRVQDNYVTQWGDPDGDDKAKAKPLPAGLATVPESEYSYALRGSLRFFPWTQRLRAAQMAAARQNADQSHAVTADFIGTFRGDGYADNTVFIEGWPIGVDAKPTLAWPVHCYGMVGVGRNLSPDTGTGAELYTVIGHAPRHLDRNIALVGRIISGMENMSSLPRGTGPLGFYEKPEDRTIITNVRLASELPAVQQPHFQYLSTEGATFAAYADARANRRDPFFIHPAGGADICNIPVPIRIRP